MSSSHFASECRTAVKVPNGRGEIRPPAVHAKGRRCAADGCTTILSVYNESSMCELHRQAVKARLRRPVGWNTTVVPADEALAHILNLMSHGMTRLEIAEAAEVAKSSVYKVVSARVMGITRETEERILGVTLP